MSLWEVSAVPEFTNLSPELFQKSGVFPGLVPPPARSPQVFCWCQKFSCLKTNSAIKSCKILVCFELDFKVTHEMSICLFSTLQNLSCNSTPCIQDFKERWQTLNAQPELPELSLTAVNQQRRNKYVFNVEIKILKAFLSKKRLPLCLSHTCIS